MAKYDTHGYGYDLTDYYERPETLTPLIREGEEIIWEGKPNKRAFIWEKILGGAPLAIFWGAIDIFVISLIISSAREGNLTVDGEAVAAASDIPWLFIIPFFLIHMTPVWIWIGSFFTAIPRWRRTYYMATSQKIIVRTGLLGAEYNILFYADISNVYLRIGLLDRIFGVGDISFMSRDYRVGNNAFNDIDDPHEIFPILQGIVMDARSDMHFPNHLR